MLNVKCAVIPTLFFWFGFNLDFIDYIKLLMVACGP